VGDREPLRGPAAPLGSVGVQSWTTSEAYGRVKLHVLNACHCALAYLGRRALHLRREAIAGRGACSILDSWVSIEIAPALHPLPVLDYWRSGSRAIRQPANRLSAVTDRRGRLMKVAERLFPL